MTTRSTHLFAAVLVATTLTSRCTAGATTDAPRPQGGDDAHAGPVRLDDIWLDGPQGVAAGEDAPLHLTIANDSARPDALVKVTTPAAERVVLERDGHTVQRLAAPARRLVDLERYRSVLLHDVRRPLHVGEWFPVTFDFAHAGEVTVSVTVGPLAADPTESTHSNPKHGGAS